MVERDASERPGVLLLRRSRAKVIQSARPGKIVTIWNKSGSDSELDAQKYDGHKFKRISSFIVRPSRYRDMDISLTFTKKKKFRTYEHNSMHFWSDRAMSHRLGTLRLTWHAL